MLNVTHHSVQFTLVAQSCPTLCDPMNRSTPGLPVHHQLIRKLQTKTMRYHYIPIRMAKIQNIETSNIGENVEQQELSCFAGGNAKWYRHFGNQFGVFLQLNILLSHNPAVMLLVFTQISWKHMYTNIPALAWLQARNQQMYFSIGEWINKFCYVHTNEFSPVLKMCVLSGHWGTLNSISKWKKPIWKVCRLYNSNMTFWKRQNYGDSKKFSGQGFLGSEAILYYTIMVYVWYTFFKIHIINKTKNEP